MSARPRLRVVKLKPPAEGPFRIRVGNGEEEGFLKLDLAPPWPIEDGAVDAIYSAFQFHRLGRPDRYRFMNEAFRVLKPGGQLSLVVPHWSSMRAITDPLAEWPPLCESSFMVYNRRWRESEQMTDLPLTCDFGDVYGYGHSLDPDIAVRNDEFQQQAKKHWVNAILDLHVTLTKQ
jgi:SAM-dependent methyltransferase